MIEGCSGLVVVTASITVTDRCRVLVGEMMATAVDCVLVLS